jgi:multicomponent Na+:H+ antiporter subunit E
MKLKNISITFLVILVTWLLLNGNLKPPTVGIGIIVSLTVTLMFCTKCDLFSDLKLNPKSIFYMIAYIFVFIWELIKANFDVAKIVLSPSLPINPGILEVNTKLKSKMGRLILANSITLTPGTLTVDIIDDKMYIHQVAITDIDTKKATNSIVRTFEKYLEVIYG